MGLFPEVAGKRQEIHKVDVPVPVRVQPLVQLHCGRFLAEAVGEGEKVGKVHAAVDHEISDQIRGSADAPVQPEGILIGVLSWLVGAILAFPISRVLGNAIGAIFLNSPLNHIFSIGGVVIWLIVVILLSALASFLPAWNASRLTVQEVLAYE